MFSGQNPAACSVLRMKNTVWTQCWVGDGAKGTVQWLIRGAREPTLTTALLPYLPTSPCSTLSTTCVLYPCISLHITTLSYHHPPPNLLHFHITTLLTHLQYFSLPNFLKPVAPTFNCIIQQLVHIHDRFVTIYLPCVLH